MSAVIKLAVVTPTYNRPDLLERLHRSLLSTGGVDWHHYVVDDGSEASYAQVVENCANLSGRLTYNRITNSGPLIARNVAIDRALEDNCTHICFFDDDDQMIPTGMTAIVNRIRQFPTIDWFMFPGTDGLQAVLPWPREPVLVNWFEDVVRGRQFGSDNAVVVTAGLVGTTRFSQRGRNQREWTFFLDISDKRNDILVCPEAVRQITYLPGGLSSQAAARRQSREQIINGLERALRYWWRKPLSLSLMVNVVRQLGLAPLRYLFTRALRYEQIRD